MQTLQDRADQLLAHPLVPRPSVEALRTAAQRRRRRRRRLTGAAVVGLVAIAVLVTGAAVWRSPTSVVVRTTTPSNSEPVERGPGHLLTIVSSDNIPLLVQRSAATGRIERTVRALPTDGGTPTQLAMPNAGRVVYVASFTVPFCPAPIPPQTDTGCRPFGYVEALPLDPADGPPVRYSSEAASAIAVTPDGSLLAWATTNNDTATLHFRDLHSGRESFTSFESASSGSNSSWQIQTLSFSSNGRHLAASISTGSGLVVETLDGLAGLAPSGQLQIPRTHLVGPLAKGTDWSSAVYRGSNNQLVAIATGTAVDTQLVTIDPGTGESKPLLRPGSTNPFARTGSFVQLSSDPRGTVFAWTPTLCGVCQGGGGGWAIFRVDSTPRLLASGSNLPLTPQGAAGQPAAITWMR